MVQEARIDRRLKLVPFAGSQYCFVIVSQVIYDVTAGAWGKKF